MNIRYLDNFDFKNCQGFKIKSFYFQEHLFSNMFKSFLNRKTVIFFLIIFIGAFLRLYNLSSVPPSASLDEASIGYNAYSILNTGADEFGTRFPILLRAYDDWRPALYVYLVVPFVKLLGLSVFAVRLPSVILSILTVITTYFIAKEMFLNFKKFSVFNFQFSIGEIVALLLAISPWHIYLSRLGHEANAGFAFFIFGLYFFIKNRIYIAAVFTALSFISYQSEKVFIPVMMLVIVLIYRKTFFRQKKKLLIAGFIFLLIVLPFIKETLSPNALIRFKATNVFAAQGERFEKQAILNAKAIEDNNILGRIVYNRRILSSQIFIENYISHFNPTWLFTNPSDDKHKVPGLGILYYWEAPLILLGIIFLARSRIDSKLKMLIILWTLAAPLPAALTTDAPHVMRIYQMLPIPQIFAGFGLYKIMTTLVNKNIFYNRMISLISIVIFLLSIFYLYKQYFVVFPNTQSNSFQYALSNIIPFVLEKEKNYNKIIFSNQENLYQSYMFFLFYSKYDPIFYQKEGGTKSGGYAETHKFGKYEFRPIKLKEEKGANSLYVGNENDFPEGTVVVNEFSNMDGKNVIKIVNNGKN